MTLLDLPVDCTATICRMNIDDRHLERLHAVGIFVNSTVTKSQASAPNQPIVVSTQHRNTFAISCGLAAQIFIDAI